MQVSPRFYRRFCVYGRSPKNLIASVALRTAAPTELFAGFQHAVILDEVWTHRAHRGQGLARGLLHLALESAYRHAWTVYCNPIAHDSGPGPSQTQLEEFYVSMGFRLMEGSAPWLNWSPTVGHRAAA